MLMKKRWGDRRDGTLVRDIDGMHYIMPLLYPNRCDNETYLYEVFDLEKVNEYLKKKNADDPEYKYNLFQFVLTALLRTVTLRPKLNYFIANKTLYKRNELSASFVIKKQFSDKGEEGLAFIHAKDDFNIDDVNREIKRQVFAARHEGGKKDASSDAMDLFTKMPRFISRFLIWIICILDRHGMVPPSLIETDPYYSSIVLTNLGSIGLHATYHHLTNWGTNSLFCAVGQIKKRPFYDEEGNGVMKDSIDLGITIDERLADGYYYSKTIRLIKKLFENPELLEQKLTEEVEY